MGAGTWEWTWSESIRLGGVPPLVVRTSRSSLRASDGGRYTIGRDPDCDVYVDDPRVSREHAALRVIDGIWVLEDLSSRNGTWLDGERVYRLEITGSLVVRLASADGRPTDRAGGADAAAGPGRSDAPVDASTSPGHAGTAAQRPRCRRAQRRRRDAGPGFRRPPPASSAASAASAAIARQPYVPEPADPDGQPGSGRVGGPPTVASGGSPSRLVGSPSRLVVHRAAGVRAACSGGRPRPAGSPSRRGGRLRRDTPAAPAARAGALPARPVPVKRARRRAVQRAGQHRARRARRRRPLKSFPCGRAGPGRAARPARAWP